MKNFLRRLQSDVAAQVEANGVSVQPSAASRLAVAGVMAAAAIAALYSTNAQAQVTGSQYQAREGQYEAGEARQIINAAGRMGHAVGNEVGRSTGLGHDAGRLLGVTATTFAKVATGQNVNRADAGGTIGQLTGAIAGYQLAKDKSNATKTVAVVAGGVLGAVFGGRIGHDMDVKEAQAAEAARIERANAMAPAVRLSAEDQLAFVQSMQAYMATHPAMDDRQPQMRHASDRQRTPSPDAAFSGFFGQLVNTSQVKLLPSGANTPTDEQLEAVATKAMEVAKLARQYKASEDGWDKAFMNSLSNQAKNQSYFQVAGDLEALKLKIRDYVQVRNAAASQGANVTPIDGALNAQAKDLQPITNYNFVVSKTALAHGR